MRSFCHVGRRRLLRPLAVAAITCPTIGRMVKYRALLTDTHTSLRTQRWQLAVAPVVASRPNSHARLDASMARALQIYFRLTSIGSQAKSDDVQRAGDARLEVVHVVS